MLPVEATVELVFNRLNGDAQLAAVIGNRLHRDLAPPAASYPLVTVSAFTAVDMLTQNGTPIWQDVQVLVKCMGKDRNYAPLRTAADRIQALLQGYSGTVLGVYIVKLRRESAPPEPFDVIESTTYAYLNQIYRTEAHAA